MRDERFNLGVVEGAEVVGPTTVFMGNRLTREMTR